MTTPFHAKYWAHSLLLARPQDGVEALSRSIGNARVDLNPHQLDAALFALRSPYSRGVLLADEVGLGKTIEAALILAQKWAERRRRILLIVPATLRKQWQLELEGKFFLPSVILETKSANDLVRKGVANPFEVEDRIVIASYQFAYARRTLIEQVGWDLVVIDEAHRLRSIYKGTKTAEGIVESIRPARKLLLTATPLQNSLLELYGLVGILDSEIFGGQDAFQEQFMGAESTETRDLALRERLRHVCKRTLRRDVLEYIPFTQRFTHTADFVPTPAEQQLYDEVSAYLQREELVALPNARRALMTLILRKLLASSSAAIGATLAKFAERLSKETAWTSPPDSRHVQAVPLSRSGEGSQANHHEMEGEGSDPLENALEDYEGLDELSEQWGEGEAEAEPALSDIAQKARGELSDLERFVALAKSIERDSKAAKLVDVLPVAFELAAEKGAARKAVIFTESRKTQEYLVELLNENGYEGQIVLMNGTNTDEMSKRIYADWKQRNEHRWEDVSSGSKTADMKAAIVEEFRDRGTLLIATESAAEGVNLQFCSIVVNYDLPWNPQRIEQRIGRCHRYGQKCDVLVVNFLNRKNEADARVFELLDEKFRLFHGVFGASDDVLGVVESGVDLEKRIAAIYQESRTPEEIRAAFDALQTELEEKIREGMDNARRAFLDNFDAEVHERLRIHKEAAKESLDLQQRMLLDLAKYSLRDGAIFDEDEPRFRIPQGHTQQRFHLDWQRAEEDGDAFFRLGHPLAERIIGEAIAKETPIAEIRFAYEPHASALLPFVGKGGWLSVTKLATFAVGRREEHLLFAACDDGGEPIDHEVVAKLFSLSGEILGNAQGDPPSLLDEIRDRLKRDLLARLESRNEEFFREEEDKLDRWADDRKLSLEKELKQIDIEIRAARAASRKKLGLEEKVEAQKLVRALEKRQVDKRRQIFAAQDEIDKKRGELIGEIEKQLETSVQCEGVMTVRWGVQAI